MRVRLSASDRFIGGTAELWPRETRSLEHSFADDIESLKLGDGEVSLSPRAQDRPGDVRRARRRLRVYVDPDEPAAYDHIATVRANGPGSATLVRLMPVESGRSVLRRAATPSFLDITVTRANETTVRAVVAFVGRAA